MAEQSEFQVTIQGTGEPGKVRDAIRSYLRDLNSGKSIAVSDATFLFGPEPNRQREHVWPLQGEAAPKAKASKK